MKVVLAAMNAKYVHSNLAVYDIEAYAKKHLNREFRMYSEEMSAEKQRNRELRTYGEETGTSKATSLPELVIKEYTINHNLDSILQSLYLEKAEVVAFSCYIWNIFEVLSIARELHKVAPSVRIWLGGPEVSYDSKTILEENPHIEGIMRGEGEETFYELVKCWRNLVEREVLPGAEEAGTCAEWMAERTSESDKNYGKSECSSGFANCYHNIKGITYRTRSGQICENPARPLMSLDDVPFIYQDLSRFENKILYYETSRGCPFSCSYCLSSIDKSVRFRSLELVEKELQFFLDHKVPQVKFIDRTFNCKREHSMAIWNYITEHDNGVTNFHFEVAADLIGEEELQLFGRMRPGLIQLEIGLQSTNPATIQEIHRVMNIDRLKENMTVVREYGNIHQHLDLIAGLPYEDFETFKKSFNDAYEMKPNQLQLGFLKVLKGSYMGEQIAAYGLQYQDIQPYEVLCTKWISYDEILQLKIVEEMVEVYYNSDQFEHVLAYLVPFFASPYAFYEMLGNYYKRHELFGIGFKREARYQALKEFCTEWMSGEFDKADGYDFSRLIGNNENDGNIENGFSMKIFISLLTYDYYLRENAKSRPSWSKEEPIDKTEYHTFFKNGGTEEVQLEKEGYDSKVAARMMHIEPFVRDALCWLTGGKRNVDTFPDNCETIYGLFDYENRNPLSKDADVVLLSHL